MIRPWGGRPFRSIGCNSKWESDGLYARPSQQAVILVTAFLGAICDYENELQFQLESRQPRFYFWVICCDCVVTSTKTGGER